MDFSLIEKWKQDLLAQEASEDINMNIYVFPQVWGSSATAFGGMGLAALTKAYTVIIIYDCYDHGQKNAFVWVNSRLAYNIHMNSSAKENIWNENFIHDLNLHNMADAATAKKRYKDMNNTVFTYEYDDSAS